MRIVVTGASGKVGGEVARLLHGAPGVELRIVGRRIERLPELAGVERAAASFADADACRAAFDGADALLLVSAGEADDRLDQHRTAIEAASRAGVGHVVYTSFLGASPTAAFTLARDHGATEEMLRGSGLDWTFLRDSFYADVLLDFAGTERVIRGPGGTGRCAFVARRDVAEVAARILRDPAPYAGRALDLTGPVAVSLAEAALALTRGTGEEYEYVDETMAEGRASRAPYGAPDWQVEAWISTYTAIRDGELDLVSGDVREVLGRAPRGVEETVADPL
jgi:NAD(P)H dehydrogenase (quinone)